MKQLRKWSNGIDLTVSFFFNRNRCNCFTFQIGPNVTVTLLNSVLIVTVTLSEGSQCNC